MHSIAIEEGDAVRVVSGKYKGSVAVVVSETLKCFWIKLSYGDVVRKDKGNVVLIVDMTQLLRAENHLKKTTATTQQNLLHHQRHPQLIKLINRLSILNEARVFLVRLSQKE
jgi:ribosomal protein L24